MRLIVVNLTRLGDLLQTQPVIAALKAQGHQVSLVCLENFAGAAALMPGVDRVCPLPGAALLGGVQSGAQTGWPGTVALLQAWVDTQRREMSPQKVINLTASPGARLLARLLAQGATQSGFGLDDMGFGLCGNAWGVYVQAATLNRGCSPFNLVDGFRAMAEVADIMPVYLLKKPPVEIGGFLPNIEGAKGFVALQLGASEERRRWPVPCFAQTGECLWREAGLVPLLLGSAAEKPLARKYAACARGTPFADLTGSTNLEQLAGVLAATRLIITNDTGTMHLAAGLGVPVLAVFLATAQPWDTGPYVENACLLEPDMPCHPCGFGRECMHGHACRQAVQPHVVTALALNYLKSGQWQAEQTEGSRVWISCRYAEDACGFLDLRPLKPLANWATDDRVLWIRQQNFFYRQFLDEVSGQSKVMLPKAAPLSQKSGVQLGALLASVAGLTGLMAEQERMLEAGTNTEKTGAAFLQSSRRLADLLASDQRLCVLSLLWKSALQDLGGDLPGLGHFLRVLHGQTLQLAGSIQKSKTE